MDPQSTESKSWALPLGSAAVLLGAGWVQAMSLALPFDGALKGEPLGWLQIVSLATLAGLLDRSSSKKQAFTIGWLFSLAWLIGSTWWLFISMNSYGGLPAPLAALAVGLLAAGLALIYGAACAVFHAVSKIGVGVIARASAFSAVWALAEMVRGTLWTGFPWGAVGYAHVDSWLQHWAPWIGVYGLCALSAFVAMAAAAERRRRGPVTRMVQISMLVCVAVLGYTWFTSPSRNVSDEQRAAKPITVTLLQGNIPQDLKFGEGVNRALRDYREALLSSNSDLTVTPETAIPLIQQQMPDRYWAQLENHFGKGSQAALIGLPLAIRSEQGQLQYSNSAIALMAQASPAATAGYQYDKHHLVPFGEFVPPLFQWFVRMMNIPLGDFTRGDVAQPSFAFKGERIAPNICYEDLFGEELARSFADPDKAPTMMINLSNIAWFGDTVAIDQHLNISRMRALELGRPMLRATNTGATAIINAQGQVTHRLPSAVQGALTAEVYGVHGPVTPYAKWVSVLGLWPLAGLAVLTLLIVAAMAHASRHGQRRFGP
jgi:apolipoprotein N-acyltransferase